MSVDPLERAKGLLDDAARERDGLRHRMTTAELEAHQLRRRLERAQEQYLKLDERHAELEQRLEAAERAVEQSRRALSDHAART